VWDQPAGDVGGDFILRARASDTLRVFLGDACGHGGDAAPLARATCRMIAADLGRPLDERLLRRWHRKTLRRFPDRFVCLTAIELDPLTGQGMLLNAGNPEVLIRRDDGAIEALSSTGMPLGLVEDAAWHPGPFRTIRLRPRDMLLCFSDGLIERVGLDRGCFGLERVQRAFALDRSASPIRTLRRWLARFASITTDQDDLSILCLRTAGAAA
jgi:sigma-B regulation protein RsbU (phosphoserine phosphatase)